MLKTKLLDVARVPADLRQLPNWVCWRYEERNGKLTKVPKNPHTGANADVTDPRTWTDFETALHARDWFGFDGIGLVLTERLGLVAWDFDHCKREDGSWRGEVLELVRQLDSYTEVTPSGEGLRVLCRGSIPRNRKDQARGIEVYQDRRFVTITGNHLEGTPLTVEHRQEAIDLVFARVFGQAKTDTPAPAPAPVALNDDELLQRAFSAENGAKFRALWHGDSTGYPSESEADLALMSMLLFWTGGDTARAERLFSQSPRGQREKWRTRADYRQMTVQAALEGKTEFYRRNGHKPEECVEAEKTYRHLLHLREMFAGRFRWCPEWKTWLQWDGTLWVRAPQESLAAAATEQLREFYARQVADAPTHGEAEKWTKRLLDLFSTRHVQDAVELLRGYPEFLTYAAEFDREPYLLNCRNGILDLRTLELRPHDPDALCTRVVNARYDPAAEAPRWEQFLHEIFAGDTELIRFMQRACGMSLIGENRHHLLLVLHGTGANGKSTFLRTLRHVFGSYGGAIPRDALLTRRHQQDAARTAYSALVGLRFATLEELSDEASLSVVAVKDLTSGNPMQVRALYENYREVRLGMTAFVAVNSRPGIHEHTEGTWRRLRLVPFNVVIPPERRDPELGEKLAREADGILRWLVDGLRDYWAHGLQEPPAVVEATREYRSEQDVLEAFLNECCEVSPRALTPSAELYEAYRQWALAQGEREEELLSERAFGQRLTKRGFGTAKGTGGARLRRGLRLKTHDKSGVSGNSGVSTENSPRESDCGEVSIENAPNATFATAPPLEEDVPRRATPLGTACRAVETVLRGGREATKEELRRATRLPPPLLEEAIAHMLRTGEMECTAGRYRLVEAIDDG